MRQKILVDESIFVIADRSNDSLHSQLMMFLEQAQKNDSKRKYDLYLTSISRRRMGMYRWFQIKCIAKCVWCDARRKEAMQKRRWRVRIAKKLVRGFKKRSFGAAISQSNLMDVFMYANEAKSRYIEQRDGRRMIPEEIIPLEACSIAQIAHRARIPFLSFNTDFRFFGTRPEVSWFYV